MDVALMKVGHGSPHRITAAELQRQYGSQVPKGVKFICPSCGQPVKPCAMARNGTQSPHFRHKNNNEIAQQCELYNSVMGSNPGREHQRIPMPMFIHQLSLSHDRFVVEGGFKAIEKTTLQMLEKSHAQIKMGLKRYNVCERRFGAGLTRLPFEDISLAPAMNVQLINSPIRFEAIWNPPENATTAMVFSCEHETLQGRRLRTGESVAAGADLLLLAPMREDTVITKTFQGSRKVGFAGSTLGASKLQVFRVRLSTGGHRLREETDYLKSCGINVDESDVGPELLWPPSLVGDGEIRPLFGSSDLVFGVNSSWTGNAAFISDDLTCASFSLPQELLPSESGELNFLILNPSSAVRLLLMGSSSSNGAVLVGVSSPNVVMPLALQGEDVKVIENSDGSVQVSSASPISVTRLRKGHAWEKWDLKTEASVLTLAPSSSDLIRVVKRLLSSRWQITIWERTPKRAPAPVSSVGPIDDSHRGTRERLLESIMPCDKRLSRARLSGLPRLAISSHDRELALIRGANR